MICRVFSIAVLAGTILAPAPASAHFTSGCEGDVCKRHVVAPHEDRLDRMHYCEARGVGWFYDGKFDGGLQFSPSTWSATGSKYRFAFLAPVLEQKYRAVIWASKIKWAWRSRGGWPNCG